MILKAGTYRFNDVLSFDGTISQDLDFISKAGGVDTDMLYKNMTFYESYNYLEQITFSKCLVYVSSSTSTDQPVYGINIGEGIDGWLTAIGLLDGVRNVTFETDQTVSDNFGNVFISNTNYNEVNGIVSKPLAEITYNGETIAQLNAGETAKLSCEGKKMASDVVVKVNKIEEPKDDSIVGAWVFNKTLTPPSFDYTEVEVYFYYNLYSDQESNYWKGLGGDGTINPTALSSFSPYEEAGDTFYNFNNNSWNKTNRTIIIVYYTYHEAFETWLKANATKQ